MSSTADGTACHKCNQHGIRRCSRLKRASAPQLALRSSTLGGLKTPRASAEYWKLAWHSLFSGHAQLQNGSVENVSHVSHPSENLALL